MEKISYRNDASFFYEICERYDEYGVVYIKDFYDIKSEINPVRQGIYDIIKLIIKENKLKIEQDHFSEDTFDSGLDEILEKNRNCVSILYDAVKKLAPYVRLACSEKNELLSCNVLKTKTIGFHHRGYGMRMDHPNRDETLTQWHQDYVSNLCSMKGIVFWSPLRFTSLEIGPVEICVGSHKEGVFKILKNGDGSYGLKIKNEQNIITKFRSVIPEVYPGDLVIIDYLTVHRSSPNRSKFTRWAMISRYFDFLDQTGISYGWKGGLQEGNSFERIHPDWTEFNGSQ